LGVFHMGKRGKIWVLYGKCLIMDGKGNAGMTMP
jgi:hypothetical protein